MEGGKKTSTGGGIAKKQQDEAENVKPFPAGSSRLEGTLPSLHQLREPVSILLKSI